MNKFKSEAGSMAVYVTIVLFIMLVFIVAVYMRTITVRKEQIVTASKIKESYEKDNERIDEIYANIVGENTDGINIDEAIESGTNFSKTTTVYDKLNNTVVIPGGFHFASDSENIVEKGIVIEDDAGNQFVWIPTGTYQTSTGEKTNDLSRRIFTSSGATGVTEDNVIENYFYGEENSNSVANSEITGFKTSAESIANGGNGGFYVGR